MKRIWSGLKLAVPLVLLLATTAIATSLLPTVARADYEELGSWTSQDGTSFTVYQNDDGTEATYVEKNGKALVTYSTLIATSVMQMPGFKWSGEESGTSDAVGKGSRTEPIDVGSLIKKGLITIINIKANPENTPLAKWIDAEGSGMIPHYNPSDDDNKGRPGLPKVKNTEGGLTDKQKAEITKLVNYAAKTLEGIGTSMGDGEALGGESAPTFNKSGSSGRGKGTGTGKGSKNTGVYVPRDIDTLGPRPDLVNPPHGKSGASSAMTPGLLDSGSSFSTNGPSGAGMAIGKGGGTTSRGAGAAGIR